MSVRLWPALGDAGWNLVSESYVRVARDGAADPGTGRENQHSEDGKPHRATVQLHTLSPTIRSMLAIWMQTVTTSMADRISSIDGKEGAIRMFRSLGSFP